MRTRCREAKVRTRIFGNRCLKLCEAGFVESRSPLVSVVVPGGSRVSSLGEYVRSVRRGSACGGCRCVVMRGGDASSTAFRCCGGLRTRGPGIHVMC